MSVQIGESSYIFSFVFQNGLISTHPNFVFNTTPNLAYLSLGQGRVRLLTRCIFGPKHVPDMG